MDFPWNKPRQVNSSKLSVYEFCNKSMAEFDVGKGQTVENAGTICNFKFFFYQSMQRTCLSRFHLGFGSVTGS